MRQKVGTLTTAATGSEMGKVAAEVKQTKVHMILCNLGRRVNRGVLRIVLLRPEMIRVKSSRRNKWPLFQNLVLGKGCSSKIYSLENE